MAGKSWYVALGGQRVGPLTDDELRRRITAENLPDSTKVWTQGMEGWTSLGGLPEFASLFRTGGPAPSGFEPSTGMNRGAGAFDTGSSRDDGSTSSRPAAQGSIIDRFFPDELPLRFKQPHRIGWRDVWGGFALGFDRNRALVALASFGATTLVGGILFGIALIAARVTAVLALPFVVAGAAAAIAISFVGLGALSFQAREKILEGSSPAFGVALAWARQHAVSLALTPIIVSVTIAAPLIVLGLLGVVALIPYAGPILTGLIFGVHLALGLATVFLIVAAALAWTFAPIIVAFEETTVMETMQVLFNLVRSAVVRLLLWAILPSMALSLVAMLVMWVGMVALSIPVGITGGISGFPSLLGMQMLMAGGGLDMVQMPGGSVIGLFPTGIWIGLFYASLLAVVMAMQNGVMALLYLGARPGNDDLISRDTYLARKSGGDAA
ncbi:MAG: DUF4339 domain-containing protein [Candidatus Schekmanbacteria bacterium]|nr:DUF4339 domain-containing protein [Candidatus Schekmanbacteria bacterium]